MNRKNYKQTLQPTLSRSRDKYLYALVVAYYSRIKHRTEKLFHGLMS